MLRQQIQAVGRSIIGPGARLGSGGQRGCAWFTRWLPLAILACLSLAPGEQLQAQSSASGLPFAVGEELVYRVSLGRFGTVGRGALRVEGPEQIRGRETYRLSFDFRGRVGMGVVEDRALSWFDPRQMASLRYYKYERNPLRAHQEEVELFPHERRWQSLDGRGGRSATATPLDELSFLYHIRMLPLRDGEAYSCNLHFDPDRNPVRIRVVRRERIAVPAGEFAVVVVEMRVNDAQRYEGSGLIRLYLTDDERRIPVRIESPMPLIGTTTLSLESAVGQRALAGSGGR